MASHSTTRLFGWHLLNTVLREELALHCLGKAIQGDHKDQRVAIGFYKNTHLNWKRFSLLVKQNRMICVVIQEMEKLKISKYVDPLVYEEMKHLYFSTLSYISAATKEYSTILDTLNHNHVQYIVLKNIFSTQSLYRYGSLKPSGDLDILISSKQEYFRVVQILFKKGYLYHLTHTSQKGHSSLIENSKHFQGQKIFKKTLIVNDSRIKYVIELHPTIVDSKELSVSPLNWEANLQLTQDMVTHTQTATINHISYKKLTTTYQLLALLMHSVVQHNMQSYVTIFEIANFINAHYRQIHWATLMKTANKYSLFSLIMWYFNLLLRFFPKIRMPFVIQAKAAQTVQKTIPRLIFEYMTYKVFHPTDYFLWSGYELEKSVCWFAIRT